MVNDVYIVGTAMTRLGKFPARSVKDMTREAVEGALADARCGIADIQAAWFANTRQGMMEGQNVIVIVAQLGMSQRADGSQHFIGISAFGHREDQ